MGHPRSALHQLYEAAPRSANPTTRAGQATLRAQAMSSSTEHGRASVALMAASVLWLCLSAVMLFDILSSEVSAKGLLVTSWHPYDLVSLVLLLVAAAMAVALLQLRPWARAALEAVTWVWTIYQVAWFWSDIQRVSHAPRASFPDFTFVAIFVEVCIIVFMGAFGITVILLLRRRSVRQALQPSAQQAFRADSRALH
jgi:hypothetical protein